MTMIYRQEMYTDGSNVLTALVPVEPGPTLFRAIGQFPAVINGQQQMAQFPVEIPGETVTEAFANLPTAVLRASEAAKAEMRKATLLVPGTNGHVPPVDAKRLRLA